MWLVAALLLSLFVAWTVMRPHLAVNMIEDGNAENSVQVDTLYDDRDRHLSQLKDLDDDYAMNKISQADYDSGKKILTKHLAATIEKLKGAGIG